jgi:hypothetical protein
MYRLHLQGTKNLRAGNQREQVAAVNVFVSLVQSSESIGIFDTCHLCFFSRKAFNDMSTEEKHLKAKACSEDVMRYCGYLHKNCEFDLRSGMKFV